MDFHGSNEQAADLTTNLLFITAYNGIGGGETVQLNLMRALAPGRYHVHLLTPRHGDFQKAAAELGITTHTLPYRGTTTVFVPALWAATPVVGKLRSLLERETIHVIISDYHSLPFVVPAANVLGIPVIWFALGWWFPIYPWQRAFFQHRIQRIIADSSAVKERLLGERPPIPPDCIDVILPGVDPAVYTPDVDGSAIRERIGIVEDTPLVAMVARFQNVKGHEYFLEAARHVLEVVPDAHFAVAGENVFDVSRDEAYKRRILQIAQNDPLLRERVTYLGFVPGAREVYAAADVIVCSSWFESLGMVALECMAMGRPIVSTNVGGPAETIVDGVTGFLVPPRNSKAIAERVVPLLQNPALRRQMGIDGRAHVQQHFTVRRFADRISEIVDQLTASPG